MPITPEKWDKAKLLFQAALDLPPERREDFLKAVDAEDDLRGEVARLLANLEQAGSFMQESAPPTAGAIPDATSSVDPDKLTIVADRFRIHQFLSRGGMGQVYRAEDLELERPVALKFLSDEIAGSSQALKRLRREAKAASALNHPNICTVYDFDDHQGVPFIAMEYLDGETLATRLTRGPCSIPEALRIGLAVSSALGAAHDAGIVHRDLKPANIMLTKNGVKLLDFGIAQTAQLFSSSHATIGSQILPNTIAGTLPYMAPEQLRGEPIDARSDQFAFGAVLYEMLTGKRAFDGGSRVETIKAVQQRNPSQVRTIFKNVPAEFVEVIERCLEKQPGDRYSSIHEVEQKLSDCNSILTGAGPGGFRSQLLRRLRRPSYAIPVALFFLALLGLPSWYGYRTYKINWARENGLPKLDFLANNMEWNEAFQLGAQLRNWIPKDQKFLRLWEFVAWSPESIRTDPPGAKVYRRPYNAPSAPWEFIGITPIKDRSFPRSDAVWKFELNGYRTVQRATLAYEFPDFLYSHMAKTGDAPPGMVRVDLSTPEAESTPVRLWGLPGYQIGAPVISMTSFWIDQFEVTNLEFKRFIDQGGYNNPAYWKEPFVQNGRNLSFSETMKRFVDQTGRPGPSTWIDGDYPKGQENYPVAGVSWFEAAAYARFVGKQLPTIYHWAAAASPYWGPSIIPASNFGSGGLAPVGQYQGMSTRGVFDMAGNVKEWIWNEGQAGQRYLMGGAWNEQTYAFYDPDQGSPFDRQSTYGFRCARYVLAGDEAKTIVRIGEQPRDYAKEKPVSDEVFDAYKRIYYYDRTPLNARVQSLPSSDPGWRIEKVNFDAAYGGEKMAGYLFLPTRSSPPYQTIVYFPGAEAIYQRTPDLNAYAEDFYFFLRSGRAVFFPVYKGTLERSDNFVGWPKMTVQYRDHIVDWSKDFCRSIDYLETRSDVDASKFAYYGVSLGAAMGAILPALEPRLKAIVLESPGFYMQRRFPEVDQINFAPRVKAPILMLNGRYDSIFPTATSQEPMYRLLGTPANQKRRVLFDSGHEFPDAPVIKEALDWLDKYLGKVK
jgi:serine/threonine protein kinase/formylglycine-generating enzyme required for sulfatase activity/cephalosporin-C deacetylase-like acetyl esterase